MTGRPRVLLLGDSIRRGYELVVKEMLETTGEAEVVAPAENCQFAAYTREHLPEWLDALGRPDVVHWNNGLHDVGHNPSRTPVQFPVDVYLDHLRAILAMLRKTGARVIWATTTPVHPSRAKNTPSWWWDNDEIDRYNAAASALMREEGVPIDDLHAAIAKDIDGLLGEDKLHLSESARYVCAEAAVAAIRQELLNCTLSDE